jgi:hypothetical protein
VAIRISDGLLDEYQMLCNLLQPYIQAQTTNWKRPIEVDLIINLEYNNGIVTYVKGM